MATVGLLLFALVLSFSPEESTSSDAFYIAEQNETTAEKARFGSELDRLSKKETFLRELISNASDALDKIRFLSLSNPAALGDGDQAVLEIRIKVDTNDASLTIWDRGIGMTRADLTMLASIALSGTHVSETANHHFGFYSVFLVAQEVTVVTKHNDDAQLVWHSSADHSSDTISEDPRGNTLGRGTQVILKLKDGALEYAKVEEITNLIKRYSQFINFPVYLWSSKEIEKRAAPEEGEEADNKSGEEEADQKRTRMTKRKAKTVKASKETVWGWHLVSDSKPIWTRSRDEITQGEYDAFFKSLTRLDDAPMAHTHFKAEGSEEEFTCILYIRPKAVQTDTSSLKLYIRRVFITTDWPLPAYLNFVTGVVDTNSLPLNVTREMLQRSGRAMLKPVTKKLVRSVLDMVTRMANAEDREQYETFWEQFGVQIKLGVIEDQANRSKLVDLLRFKTSKSDDKFVSLASYVERMKKSQKSIFLITGNSVKQVKKCAHVERLVELGYEVLYMPDRIDEYLLSNVPEYSAKKLVDVGKEKFELAAETGGEIGFLEWLKTALYEQIEGAYAVVETLWSMIPNAFRVT